MRKKLTALILIATVPILFCMAWFMSNRSFSLSMDREKQRIQMTETIVFREIQNTMGSADFSTAAAYARQYHEVYLSQGIELIFCWNGIPIADAQLPNGNYEGMLIGRRCAMLDTVSTPQRYAVAEPVNDRLTMLLMRDVSDIYRLKQDYRLIAFGCAGAASVLLAVLVVFFTGFLTRPIRKLTEAAKALAEHRDRQVSLPVDRKDEIGTLAGAFSEMQDAVSAREKELQEESASRQALLDALAHEMRTPLTSLLGNVRLLQRDLPPEDRKRMTESMAKEIHRLTDMDQQLMKLTNLRNEEPETEPVSVLSLLNETAERMRDTAGEIGIEVTGEDSRIAGDRELLSLLAGNLVANAVHASSPGMTVTLSAVPGGFRVRDIGIGMSQEALQHACEPFWKADKARTRMQGGAGLGLSLCRRIAELHRGRLEFESEPGKGTAVTFTTPLQPDDDSFTTPVA